MLFSPVPLPSDLLPVFLSVSQSLVRLSSMLSPPLAVLETGIRVCDDGKEGDQMGLTGIRDSSSSISTEVDGSSRNAHGSIQKYPGTLLASPRCPRLVVSSSIEVAGRAVASPCRP